MKDAKAIRRRERRKQMWKEFWIGLWVFLKNPAAYIRKIR